MAINLKYTSVLVQRLKPLQFLQRTTTTTTSRQAEAVFVEQIFEEPIIAVTDKKNVDLIGPPDPVSNLRPIFRKVNINESILQRTLRLAQDETQEWNQHFWAQHNTRFNNERKEFIKAKQKELGISETLNAEQMSEFYKRFLDDNWKLHLSYNLEWYKRNFKVLVLSLKACMPTGLHFVGRS